MLLVIMLIGLFRMRTDTGGSFGLGRVLLKQVRFSFTGCDTPKTHQAKFLICQGLIWLLIATVAEVPPPVSLAVFCTFFAPIYISRHRCS